MQDSEVEIFEVDVEIGMNELVLDHLPDDPRHLVAVHFDDRVFDLDFLHGGSTGGGRKAPCGALRRL
jgi:hypothetical protein